MGMKKSVVEINADPFFKSYTAASSLLWFPTSKRSLSGILKLECKISSNILGDILQPQPAP